ncbi:hypothetical protein [Mycoplasma buteonis]|uniref:hypothetical protein n=1 Tax=Mycoplasma buteonis TaxID=171280 RepID=UPI00055F6B25|nr:hypothetical protein [Mycoplasma buteonis]
MTEHNTDYLKTVEEIRWKRKDGLYVKPQSAEELKEWYKETKSKKFFDNANDLFWNQYKKYFIVSRFLILIGIFLFLFSIIGIDLFFGFWYVRIPVGLVGLCLLAAGTLNLFKFRKYGMNRFEWYKTAFSYGKEAVSPKMEKQIKRDNDSFQKIMNLVKEDENKLLMIKNHLLSIYLTKFEKIMKSENTAVFWKSALFSIKTIIVPILITWIIDTRFTDSNSLISWYGFSTENTLPIAITLFVIAVLINIFLLRFHDMFFLFNVPLFRTTHLEQLGFNLNSAILFRAISTYENEPNLTNLEILLTFSETKKEIYKFLFNEELNEMGELLNTYAKFQNKKTNKSDTEENKK